MVNVRQTIHEGAIFRQQIFSVIDIFRSIEEVNREIAEKEVRSIIKGHIYSSKNDYFATEGVAFWNTLTDITGFKEILKHYMTKPEYKSGYSNTYKLYMEELSKYHKLRMEIFNKFAFVNNEGEIIIRISFINMLVMEGKSTSFIKALIDKYNARNKVGIKLQKWKFPMASNFSTIYRDAYIINVSDVSIITSVMKNREKAKYVEEIMKEIKASRADLITQKEMEERMKNELSNSNLTISSEPEPEQPKPDEDFEAIIELVREAWNKKSSADPSKIKELETRIAELEKTNSCYEAENKKLNSEVEFYQAENEGLEKKLKQMQDEAEEMRTFIEKGMKFLNR